MSTVDAIEKRLPGYPHGKPGQIRDAAAAFRSLASGVGHLTDGGESSIRSRISSWQDPTKTAFIEEWSKFKNGLNDLSSQLNTAAGRLDELANDIEAAQRKYDAAIAAVGVTVVVGAAFTVLTAGASDVAAAEAVAVEVGAATAAVEASMSFVAGLLEASTALIGVTATRLVVFFAANIAAQSVADTIVYPDHDPFSHIDVGSAALTAGSLTALGGASGLFGKIGIAGSPVNTAARVGGVTLSGGAIDAASQEIFNGRINLGEVVASGAFAGLTERIAPAGAGRSINAKEPPGASPPVIDLELGDWPDFDQLAPSSVYRFRNQIYETDEQGRVVVAHIENVSTGYATPRNRRSTEVGKVGLPGDEGGHIFRIEWGGYPTAPNVTPQAWQMNRGAQSEWYAFESHVSDLVRPGDGKVIPKVDVEVRLEHVEGSVRPSAFEIMWWIDGVPQRPQILLNK